MQGSCRPVIVSSAGSIRERLTVRWGLPIDGVGFMEIDMTGQVASEAIGPRQYSGTGGQLEWVLGAQWSKGGKSIIAIHSCYRDKSGTLQSKILPSLAVGSIVTTPRTCVQYVVTEYGVANLKYKSTLERARALIEIAHPDFREELKRQLPF